MPALGSELGAGLGGLHRTPVRTAARSSRCLRADWGRSPVWWDGATRIFGINEVSALLQWGNTDRNRPLLPRCRGDRVQLKELEEGFSHVWGFSLVCLA